MASSVTSLRQPDILWKIPVAAFVYFITYGSLAVVAASFLNRVGAAAGVFLAGLYGLNGIAIFFLEASEAPGSKWATLLAFEQHPRYIRDWIFNTDLVELHARTSRIRAGCLASCGAGSDGRLDHCCAVAI